MKTTIMLLASIFSILFMASCSKENQAPRIVFSNNVSEGQASADGTFTLTGTLTSEVNLSKVTLTKERQSSPFLVDDSEAKNKNEYSFSTLVSGINTNTTILLLAYDQSGGKTSARFLIKK